MVETTIKCPHCGFESEDDEMCQACGALFEDTPVRDISFAQVIGGFFSWLQDKGLHGLDDDAFEEDPMTDPGWSTLTGNFYNRIDED